jgi:hypothetical protein
VRVAFKAQVYLSAFDVLLAAVVNDGALTAVHEGDLMTVLIMPVQGIIRGLTVYVSKLKELDCIVAAQVYRSCRLKNGIVILLLSLRHDVFHSDPPFFGSLTFFNVMIISHYFFEINTL